MNATSSTKLSDWIKKSTQALKRVGIESAQLDCLILLEDVLHKDRAHLLAHPELALTDSQTARLNTLIARRAAREPLAYIRGHVEFYGRSFMVDNRVLIPRPESESFVSLLLKKHMFSGSLLDVGTGSGVLGITAKLEAPQLTVMLSDVSQSALSLAKANATSHGIQVKFFCKNLLDAFNKNNIVFANLPYVPTTHKRKDVESELSYEPNVALYAGVNGMDLYRDFWEQLAKLPNKPQFVYTESLTSQHEHMINFARVAGYKIEEKDGLVQVFTLHPASVQASRQA